MSARGFNKGIVWGRLGSFQDKLSEGNNVPYLNLQIECSNEKFGDTKVYGRVWGEKRVTAFKQEITDGKFTKGSSLRLEGFFGQYDGEEGRRLNNYTFSKYAPTEATEYRAAFILAGTVEDIFPTADEVCIVLRIVRPGGSGKEVEEVFQLYVADDSEVQDVEFGQFLRVKGILAEQGREDFFGDKSGVFRAYIKELKIVEPTV